MKCLNSYSNFTVPKGQINNIPALVQIMAWRRPGDKPLSEPMMVSLTMHICVIRPQWVDKYMNLCCPACVLHMWEYFVTGWNRSQSFTFAILVCTWWLLKLIFQFYLCMTLRAPAGPRMSKSNAIDVLSGITKFHTLFFFFFFFHLSSFNDWPFIFPDFSGSLIEMLLTLEDYDDNSTNQVQYQS